MAARKSQMEATITVVVYGSLRKGLYNHHLLSKSPTTRFIGNGTLQKAGTMYSAVSFPILSLSATSTHTIVVEVYKIDEKTLAALDALEGYPRWYTRTEEKVNLEDGQSVEGWIYHQDKEQSSKYVVESGDWVVHFNSTKH